MEYGGIEDIFAGPHHPYTAVLLSAARLTTDHGPGARPLARAGLQAMMDRPGAGAACSFQASCPVKIGTACEVEPPPWQVLDREHKIRCHHPAATLIELQAPRPG